MLWCRNDVESLKKMPKTQNIYLLLFSLYWAQGLPVGFMTHALPVILRAEGVSLSQIGGFGLLMLPWSIKVFWAPLIDRQGSQRHGHYRSWIIPMQLASIMSVIILSFLPIHSLNEPIYLLALFVTLLSMNLFGATQDVATDGLAVHLLQQNKIHWGNTMQVVGSRLGFIVGGGAMLWALDQWTWQSTFLMLAGCIFLNSLAIFFFREPIHQHTVSLMEGRISQSFGQKIRHYLAYFTHTPSLALWLSVLLTCKIADGLSGPVLKPLMVDLGLSFSQIGIYITMFGAGAALFGAGVAGLSLKWLSRGQALLFFACLKVFSLMGYVWLAFQYEAQRKIDDQIIYIINAFEDFVSAMLLVVILTLVMHYSRKAMASTDFTFQVALMATVSGALYLVSGVFADYLGYATYLSLICVFALVSLIPIFLWKKSINNL